MAGPTELSQVFAGVLTPTQLAARRQMRDMAMNQQYGSDEARPWRAELARSLDTIAENTPGTQQYKDIQTAKANQDVLNSATKKYQSHLDDGQSVDDAQLSVINDAMRAFSASGNYDAIAALAPSYLALQQKGAEIAKLRQETTRSAAAQRKDEVETTLEPVKTGNTLQDSISKRDLQKAQTAKALDDVEKVNTANIVDLVNPKQGPMTATIDKKTGNATFTDPTSGQLIIRKPGQYLDKTKEKGGAGAGVQDSRTAMMFGRIANGAELGTTALENIIKGPVTADRGIFGTVAAGKDLMTAPKAVLANKLSSQDAQQYRVMIAGLKRNLSTIETSGLAPGANFTESMKAVEYEPGDTNLTKLAKLAEARQIIEHGLESMKVNPRLTDAQIEYVEKLQDRVRTSIPFTQQDVLKLENSKNKNATMSDLIGRSGLTGDPVVDKYLKK